MPPTLRIRSESYPYKLLPGSSRDCCCPLCDGNCTFNDPANVECTKCSTKFSYNATNGVGSLKQKPAEANDDGAHVESDEERAFEEQMDQLKASHKADLESVTKEKEEMQAQYNELLASSVKTEEGFRGTVAKLRSTLREKETANAAHKTELHHAKSRHEELKEANYKFAADAKEYQATVVDLRAQVTNLQSELAEAGTKMDESATEVAKLLSTFQRQTADLAAAREEKKKLKAEAAAEVERVKAEMQEAQAAEMNQIQAEVQALKISNAKELENLTASHHEELARVREEMEEQVEQAVFQREELSESHAEEMEEIMLKCGELQVESNHNKDLKERHAMEVEMMKSQMLVSHEEALACLRSEMEAAKSHAIDQKAEELIASHGQEVADLEEQHLAEIERLEESNNKKVDRMRELLKESTVSDMASHSSSESKQFEQRASSWGTILLCIAKIPCINIFASMLWMCFASDVGKLKLQVTENDELQQATKNYRTSIAQLEQQLAVARAQAKEKDVLLNEQRGLSRAKDGLLVHQYKAMKDLKLPGIDAHHPMRY